MIDHDKVFPKTSGNITSFITLTTSILSDGIPTCIPPAHQTTFLCAINHSCFLVLPPNFPRGVPAVDPQIIAWIFVCKGFSGSHGLPYQHLTGPAVIGLTQRPLDCLVLTKDLQSCWWLRLQPSSWLLSVNNHSLRGIFHLAVTIISRSSLCNMKPHKETSTCTAKEQFHSLTKAPQKLMKAGYWGVNARPKIPLRFEMRMV